MSVSEGKQGDDNIYGTCQICKQQVTGVPGDSAASQCADFSHKCMSPNYLNYLDIIVELLTTGKLVQSSNQARIDLHVDQGLFADPHYLVQFMETQWPELKKRKHHALTQCMGCGETFFAQNKLTKDVSPRFSFSHSHRSHRNRDSITADKWHEFGNLEIWVERDDGHVWRKIWWPGLKADWYKKHGLLPASHVEPLSDPNEEEKEERPAMAWPFFGASGLSFNPVLAAAAAAASVTGQTNQLPFNAMSMYGMNPLLNLAANLNPAALVPPPGQETTEQQNQQESLQRKHLSTSKSTGKTRKRTSGNAALVSTGESSLKKQKSTRARTSRKQQEDDDLDGFIADEAEEEEAE